MSDSAQRGDSSYVPLVGMVIRYSAGGAVHEGTIIEVTRHRHVRVDTSSIIVPPGWVLGAVTSS